MPGTSGKLGPHHLDRPGLYDLPVDPAEQHNLAAESPERVAHLRDVQRAFERAYPPLGTPLEQTEITPEQLEALRALGYVDAH